MGVTARHQGGSRGRCQDQGVFAGDRQNGPDMNAKLSTRIFLQLNDASMIE